MSHLAKKTTGIQTRWASFENPLAEKGAGGKNEAAFHIRSSRSSFFAVYHISSRNTIC